MMQQGQTWVSKLELHMIKVLNQRVCQFVSYT